MAQKLHQLFDHTALKAGSSLTQITKLCEEAKKFNFPAVCVNPFHVRSAASMLKDTDINICTVVGFPLGASTTTTKVFETIDAIHNGATEIDMVVCIDAVKEGRWEYVEKDIAEVANACHERGAVLKVILEMCMLTEDEKKKACQICVEAGADYVKTSTGMSTSGATVEDVRLMASIVKPHGIKVKAAGGIRTVKAAQAIYAAGADRVGASASVSIMKNHLFGTQVPVAQSITKNVISNITKNMRSKKDAPKKEASKKEAPKKEAPKQAPKREAPKKKIAVKILSRY